MLDIRYPHQKPAVWSCVISISTVTSMTILNRHYDVWGRPINFFQKFTVFLSFVGKWFLYIQCIRSVEHKYFEPSIFNLLNIVYCRFWYFLYSNNVCRISIVPLPLFCFEVHYWNAHQLFDVICLFAVPIIFNWNWQYKGRVGWVLKMFCLHFRFGESGQGSVCVDLSVHILKE